MKLILVTLLCALLGLLLLPKLPFAGDIYLFDMLVRYQIQYAVVALAILVLLFFHSKVLWFVFSTLFGVVFVSMNIIYYSNELVLKQGEKVSGKKSNGIRVLQANIDQLTNTEIFGHLAQHDSDIYILFGLQEDNKPSFKSFSKQLFSYGYRESENFPSQIGVISKWPISRKAAHKLAGDAFVVDLDIKFHNEVVRLLIANVGTINNEQSWKRRNLVNRSIKALAESEQSLEPLTLVVGRLNTSPWSKHFPAMENLRACIEQVGWYVSSYEKKWMKSFGVMAGQPLDHCFTSYRMRIQQFKIYELSNQHRMLQYDIVTAS